MTCPACIRAEHNPRTGIYQSGCANCDARALAQSPQAHQREADPSALQAAMRRLWKDEDEYRKGRSLVWDWIKRFESAKVMP